MKIDFECGCMLFIWHSNSDGGFVDYEPSFCAECRKRGKQTLIGKIILNVDGDKGEHIEDCP